MLEANDIIVGPGLRRGRLPAPRSWRLAHGVAASAGPLNHVRNGGRCSPATRVERESGVRRTASSNRGRYCRSMPSGLTRGNPLLSASSITRSAASSPALFVGLHLLVLAGLPTHYRTAQPLSLAEAVARLDLIDFARGGHTCRMLLLVSETDPSSSIFILVDARASDEPLVLT